MSSDVLALPVHEAELGAFLRDARAAEGAVLALFSSATRRDRSTFVGLRDLADALACPGCLHGSNRHLLGCCGNESKVLLRRNGILRAEFDEQGVFRGVTIWPPREDEFGANAHRAGAARGDWAEQLLDLFIGEPREEPFLQCAVHLMRGLLECRYGAVGIVQNGVLVRFLTSGVTADVEAQIGRTPEGRGLLGLVLDTGETLSVDDLAAHPLARGFPAGHPPMRTLLIVPIGRRAQVFGRLYFCDRLDGAPFDDQDERRAMALAGLIARLLELRRSEQSAAGLDRRLRELERVESSARLAAELTHDFANVLSAVSGYCTLLLGDREVAARMEHVEGIQSAVQRANELVRRVLHLARGTPSSTEQTEFGVVAASLEPLLRAALGSSVQLTIEVDPRMIPLKADASELEMALLNLAINSKVAMPHGGQLAIRAGVRTSEQNGMEWAFVEVEDNGVGFDEDALVRAYSPQSMRRSPIAGHGFGLESVRRFVERVGGELEIVSRDGHGALVRMHFPPATRASASAVLPEQGGRDTRNEVRRAVLLCAEATEGEVCSDHLAEYGFDSLCVDSVDAAIARAREFQTPLLVVLAGNGWPSREHVSALQQLPADIALAVLTQAPLGGDPLTSMAGRATFLDRTMPAPTVRATLQRISNSAADSDRAGR
jgi:signal transduction histidine kinase